MAFRDTSNIKPLVDQPPAKGEYTGTQLHRAAGIINNLLNFKAKIDSCVTKAQKEGFSGLTAVLFSETLPPEFMGKQQIPLCMNQYRMQFGVTRVPEPGCDRIHSTFPPKARHIIVLANDQIFAVDVLGPQGERLAIGLLEESVYVFVLRILYDAYLCGM